MMMLCVFSPNMKYYVVSMFPRFVCLRPRPCWSSRGKFCQTGGGFSYPICFFCVCGLFSPLFRSPDPTCSNGLTGIDGSNSAGDTVCCPSGCGQCGGAGCSSAGLPEYSNRDCCVNGVVDNQGNCADTGAAPCVITGRFYLKYPTLCSGRRFPARLVGFV